MARLEDIMAESSAGLARQNARRKQDMADRRSYGLGNLEARMNSALRERRGPAVGNTAGRIPWGGPHDIHRYKTGHLPGWGPTADAGSGKNWLSKIGATAGELFGGRSAMADEDEEMRLLRSGLDANTGYGSGVGSSLELMDADSQSELLNTLGLTAGAVKVPTGGIDPNSMLQDPTAGITPPNYPRWQNLWGALPWNRGGIASLRR